MSESVFVKQLLKNYSRRNVRLFRNNRGQFYTIDCVKALIGLLMSGKFSEAIDYAKRQMRMVRAGIEAPGSSDLIGWQSVVISPEMVGKTVAVFLAIEAKTATGRATAEQIQFVDVVKRAGGKSGIVRSDTDALAVLDTPTGIESHKG